MKLFLPTLALLAAVGTARAAPPGDSPVDSGSSVLIRTVPARSGVIPAIVEAYGAAATAANRVTTIGLQEDGQVGRIFVTQGETVHRGDALLEWLQSPAARQSWEQARTALVLARQGRAHVALLLDRHLATRDQLDQADKAAADAATTVDALRRAGADAPRRSITAPFDGIVATLPVSEGDHVAPGAPLATLAQAGGLVVTVGVDPQQAALLRPGQAAQVIPVTGSDSLKATLLRVDAALDPRSRLVPADLVLSPGPSAPALLPGVECRAEITTGVLQGWLVPHDAVLQADSGAFLFQTAAGKAVRVPVTVLGAQGDVDAVSGKLVSDRPVVTLGAPQLSDGAAVRTSDAS